MSSKKPYFWSADGSHLPEISSHTKAKHRVLENYIQAWIETLTGHGPQPRTVVTLIDGFCGGGAYRDGEDIWEGSAIKMLRKVEEGHRNVKQRKSFHDLDFEFLFVDNDPDHTACLKLQLKDRGYEEYLKNGKCKVITGNFDDKLNYCIERVKERRGYSFFFLDPFGLDVLPATVRRILSLGRSEILLNYMLSGLVRLIKSRETKHKELFKRLEAEDYYLNIPSSDEDFRRRQALLRDDTLKLFRHEGKAEFAHTFALISQRKSALYYLIHLSSNPTALTVMKDVTWVQNNLYFQYHYGVYGVGYKTLDDIEESLMILDINSDNVGYCIEDLAERIMDFLYDGVKDFTLPFGTIYCSTFQENPATRQLYARAINLLQQDSEIVAFRDNRLTKSKLIHPKDIIQATGCKQTILDLKVTSNYLTNKKKKRRPRVSGVINPDIEQLDFLSYET